jgi:acetate---CoA ligase (ADP-forming)
LTKKASSLAWKAIVHEACKEKVLSISEGSKSLRTSLDRLLKPRSVALIGASETPGALGDSVLRNLENSGYAGELYLVNPKRSMIRDRRCLPSISDLPEGVDCAVLAIPGSAVLEAACACARKGVGSLIVFSAGFAESGEAGKRAQHELASLAREHAMIIEGPNCLGLVNYVDGIPLTFVVTPPQPRSETPRVAIISQSGALAAVIAVNMRHHGMQLSYSISTGNEAALGVEDVLEHLVGDAQTRVMTLLVEQFRSPKRFLDLARRARESGQFIVLLHPGSSGAARESAATHTGAMAGNYKVMRTLVAYAGVIHVESMEELVDVSQILLKCGELPRGGAAVFTESGAFKALTLDLCERVGLELPQLTGKAYEQMRAALPEFIPPSNPLDLTAQGLVDPGLYRRTLAPILEDENFGSVVLCIILTDSTTTALKLPPILDSIRALKPGKPLIFAALDEGSQTVQATLDELRQLGIACFPSPERALRALSHVTKLAGRERKRGRIEPDQAFNGLEIRSGVISEYRSKEILAKLGVSVPDGGLARDVDEAVRIARAVGFPVALKAQADELAHKSDAGGVILNVASEEALAERWAELHRNLAIHKPGLALEGVLVERMGAQGVELIVGARNDPEWGPVLLAGFGGVLAEALDDTRLLPPDLSIEEICQELDQLRCAPLLRGFRGSPPVDLHAAARILGVLGQLMRAAPSIQEIDINPLVLYPEGRGAVALDALIVAAE